VLLTGSPRYDDTFFLSSGDEAPVGEGHHGRSRGHGPIQLLLTLSLHLDTEIEMIDAVCAAVEGLSGIKLSYRNHPFSRIEQHPGFNKYKDCVELARGSLEEDLAQADLILFTYSTVAEEALLMGKPVWQWLPMGFNGSALAEVVAIPQFGSVAHLRKMLRDFRLDPDCFIPEAETRRLALERLFYPGDGQAAKRIANVIKKSSFINKAPKIEVRTRL